MINFSFSTINLLSWYVFYVSDADSMQIYLCNGNKNQWKHLDNIYIWLYEVILLKFHANISIP